MTLRKDGPRKHREPTKECRRGHPWTPESERIDKRGRSCLICSKARYEESKVRRQRSRVVENDPTDPDIQRCRQELAAVLARRQSA